jgi:O-antigen ligase
MIYFIYFILAKMNIKGDGEYVGYYYLGYFIAPMFYYFLVKQIHFTARREKRYIDIIVFLLMLVVITNTFYNLIITDTGERYGAPILGVHPNNFGALYSAMFIFMLIVGKYYYKYTITYIIILAFFGMGALLSQSRAAIVALLITYIFYLISVKLNNKNVYISVVIIFIIYIITYNLELSIYHRFDTFVDSMSVGDYDVASNSRYQLWLGAFQYISDGGIWRFVTGGGLSDFRTTSIGYVDQSWSSYAHNQYLSSLTDFGIIGLSVFLYLYYILLRETKKYGNMKKDKLLIAVHYMILTFVISSFFGDRFTGLLLYFVFPIVAIANNRIIEYNRSVR